MSHLKKFLILGAILTIPVGIVSAQESRAPHPKAEPTEACVATARWVDPANRRMLDTERLLSQLSQRPIVLLGETHTSAEHHRWQLQTISALFGRNPNMVIGFEAFPRSVQPVLDRWSRGELSKAEFLEQSRWRQVWRFSPDLYMGLFDFVRMNRIPMRALNVEASLPRRIGEQGRTAIPSTEMEGVGTPAPASADYRKSLREVFDLHADKDDKKRNFDNFVAAQQTWDRAMAEALADVRQGGGEPLVIGIVGSGHLEYGYGISAQLADLGVSNAAVLLPWDRDASCQYLKSDSGTAVAHAVFGVDAPDAPPSIGKPKLGVMIKTSSQDARKGVGISRVVEGSVADAAGLKVGDLIIGGAGKSLSKASALVVLIRRQTPGTWLPLRVLRDGTEITIIAKFPAHRP
ncbi:MAG: ChaN family lipoprotein [Alphaproteobacteria bacterium]